MNKGLAHALGPCVYGMTNAIVYVLAFVLSPLAAESALALSAVVFSSEDFSSVLRLPGMAVEDLERLSVT